jgi:hypothetical protein
MKKHGAVSVIAGLALATAPLVACENLPGTREQQAAVAGGVIGGATGAATNDSHPMLGLLVGSAVGAGGGYLIGAKTDWFKRPEDARDDARRSVSVAADQPARPEDVERSSTADLNEDGFVTTDELVAMERAGLSDDEIIDRLRDSGQVFELSPARSVSCARPASATG